MHRWSKGIRPAAFIQFVETGRIVATSGGLDPGQRLSGICNLLRSNKLRD